MWKWCCLSVVCFLVAVVLGACTVEQQSTQVRSGPAEPRAIQKQVDAVRQAFIDAYQRSDARALTALFAEDATFTGTLTADWVRGKEAIQANWEKNLQAFPQRQIAFEPEPVQYYNAPSQGTTADTTVAIESGLFRMDMWDARGQKHQQIPGKYSMVLVDRNGQWLIVNYHGSRLPPAQQGERP